MAGSDMFQGIDSLLLIGQQAGSEGNSNLFSVQQVGSDTPILQFAQASPPQNNPKRLFYTAEQIDAMCEEMESAGKISRLGEFLDTLLPAELFRDSEKLAKARCVVASHRRKYAELFSLIQMRNFSPHNHKKLQDLWFDGHYAEAQLTKPEKLSNPDKFRIREKHPLPSTIFDGDKKRYGVRKSTRDILEAFFEKKRIPSKAEKEALAIQTKESLKFIKDWFKNKRNRSKKKDKNAGEASQHHSDVAPQPAAAQPCSSMMPSTGKTSQHQSDVAPPPAAAQPCSSMMPSTGKTSQHQSDMAPQPAAAQPCSSIMPSTAAHGPNPSLGYYGGPPALPPTDYSHLNMVMNSDNQQQGFGAQYPTRADQYYGGANQYYGGADQYYVDSTPYQNSIAPQYQSSSAPQYQSSAPQYQTGFAPQYQTGFAPQYQSIRAPQCRSIRSPQYQSSAPQYQTSFAPQYQISSAPQFQSSSTPQYQTSREPQYQSSAPQYQSGAAPQPSYPQNYNY